MTEAKAKYQYMDVARGLALLLVMISHAHGLSSFLIFYYIQIFFIIFISLGGVTGTISGARQNAFLCLILVTVHCCGVRMP